MNSEPVAKAVPREKVQKVMARSGLGSRREIERWIAAGRVSVNGVLTTLGDRIDPQHLELRLDGRRVDLRTPPPRVLCYYKPEGEICSRKSETSLPTVYAALPRLSQGRWISIGRLDLNASGLLLFTNDGQLAHRLMHPSTAIEREYAVRVLGYPSAEALQRLGTGVALDDGEAMFDRLWEIGGKGSNRWFHVVLCEGRKREVRRLWEAVGYRVSRLIRVRYGIIPLPRGLHAGGYYTLPDREVYRLYQSAGLRLQKRNRPHHRSSGDRSRSRRAPPRG